MIDNVPLRQGSPTLFELFLQFSNFLIFLIFRLSTQKLNGEAVKDGASCNKILPYIDTSSFGGAVLQDNATEQQMTPILSVLAPAHTSCEEEQDQQSSQKDSALFGLDISVSPILKSLGRICLLKISLMG